MRGRAAARAAVPRVDQLVLEALERRRVMAADPLVSFAGLGGTALIGEQSTFTLRFDNAGTSPGFGPYLDLYLPKTGQDGAGPAVDDGISFVSASYFGTSVASTVITLTAAGVAHPYAVAADGRPLTILPPAGFREGDQLVVLQLPFGSFVPDQLPADVQVTVGVSNLADLDAPLPIQASGGFRFGRDPLDNPHIDPTIVQAAPSTAAITPQLFALRKEYVGPEHETATGPNFTRQYRVIADIAAGQTVTNLDLTDILPGSLQYVRVDSTTGGSLVPAGSQTPSTTTPGGTLTRRLASVTGTAGDADAVLTFSFYAPELAAGGGAVLDPSTGASTTAADDARATATWTPIDGRDPVVTTTSDTTPVDHTLTLRSIATQKSRAIVIDRGSAGPTPGDVVEYTIDVQVSDYFAFDDVVITDTLGDGLVLDSSFTPTLVVSERGTSTSTPFTPATFTLTPGTGADTLTFDVSGQLDAIAARDGVLQGGHVPTATSPGTTARIRFRAIIRNTYEVAPPSGDLTVVPGDTIRNDVAVAGDVLDADTLQPTGSTAADTSHADVRIVEGTTAKSIYAINGSTSLGSPVQVTAGDLVTYRFTMQLPTTSFENLRVTDFLPLPLYDATEVMAFENVKSGTPPVEGVVRFGPADTFRGLTGRVPTLSTSAAENSFTLDFGSFDDRQDRPSTLDLLVTVRVQPEPFADRLLLTNQIVARQNDSQNDVTTQTGIHQVIVAEPSITGIRKGVVATSNPAGVFSTAAVGPAGVVFAAPGSADSFTGTITSSGLSSRPIDANLSRVDAGDLVTFAIVVENTGSGRHGAFDIALKDTLPDGFLIPTGGRGLNLQVTDGTGASFAWTDLGGGLFGSGVEIVDPGATASPGGALDPGRDATGRVIDTGRNILVITYDLQIDASVLPRELLVNTATLTSYAAAEGGTDFTGDEDPTDTASVTVTPPAIAKTLDATEIEHARNTRTQAVIGELVTYTITVTIPEGTAPGAKIVDTLDPGLAFVGLVGTPTVSAGLSIATPITPQTSIPGRIVTFDLGTIVNSDTDNSRVETVSITYQAVVLDVAGNQAGTQLKNTARFSFTGGTTVQKSSPSLTLIEPVVDVQKSAVVGTAGTVGEAGAPVTYTIVIRNAGPVDAFDLTFADPLPTAAGGASLIVSPQLTVVDTAGPAPAFELVGDAATGYTLRTPAGTSFDMAGGSNRTITLTITGSLADASLFTPGQVVTNIADVRWTSLDGEPGVRSPHSTESTERTGAGGVNDYRDTDPAVITINGGLDKLLVATSEAHTADAEVAIGEVVRYRLVFEAPQSTGNLGFIDNLPAGMRFLDDGSARVAFVSNGGGISAPLFAAAAFQTGNQSTLAGIVPTGMFPAGTITGGPFADGTDPVFSFGTVTNGDTDADKEFVVVEFNAVVLNVEANQSGSVLANTFTLTVAGNPVGSPSSAVEVTVIEPELSITKQALTATADAGDVVAFAIIVDNGTGPTAATAFDTLLSDLLPAGLELVPGSVQTSLGAVVTGNQPGATQLSVGISQLNPGESATITFSAKVAASVLPGEQVINVASAVWSSLPDGRGTLVNPTGSATPEGSGSGAGERNGSGGVNDHVGFSQDVVTLHANSIAGTVYHDQNDDGVQDGGEPGIPGVTVVLVGTDHLGNPVRETATTDADGRYAFGNLRPGSYRLEETQPAGWGDGRDAVGTPFGGVAAALGGDAITSIEIPRGGSHDGTGYDFGEVREAGLSIVKTDGTVIYRPGTSTTYTITVTNAGPSSVQGAQVLDPLPTGIVDATWSLAGATGTGAVASGSPSSGSGGLATLVDLAPGDTITFAFVVTIPAGFTGALVNTATVAPPPDTVDRTPGDDTSSDRDTQMGLLVTPDIGCDSEPFVRMIDPVTGQDLITPFLPYERGFRGGVRSTVGDFDGDGTMEIMVAPGPGRVGDVKTFSFDGVQLSTFQPFGPNYRDGIELASGATNGDAFDDLVVSKSRGVGEVQVYEGTASGLAGSPAKTFRPFGTKFRGGASVAIGDVGTFTGGQNDPATADGIGEIIIGSGLGMRPTVLLYDVSATPREVGRFEPLSAKLRGGVSVSAAYVDADQIVDVIVAGGRGARSEVEMWSGRTRQRIARSAAFASLTKSNAPVYATALDLDGDGRADELFSVQGNGSKAGTVKRSWPSSGIDWTNDATLREGLPAALRIATRGPRRV